MDITYIPMARGFVYLAVVLDWFSRRALSWRLSITMEAAFCVETLEDAMARHGKPEIFNTDQGSQFTGAAFTGTLINHGIAISMDGKGACGTMCSSSDCGAASSTRRSICGPTTASPTPVIRLAVIWTSTTAGAHTRALTAPRRSGLLQDAAPRAQPNPGRAPLIDAENLFKQSGPPHGAPRDCTRSSSAF